MRPAQQPRPDGPDEAAAGPPSLASDIRSAAPAAPASALSDALKIAAWLSIAAGLIHAVAMVDHFAHYWLYGVFFLGLTYGQVLWGVGVLRKLPTERSLKLAAIANLAICCVWLVSRTTGIPVGKYAWQPEAIGSPDVAATLDQILLAAYIYALLRPDLRAVRGFKMLLGRHRIRIGMAVCSATVFAALMGSHHHH